MRRLIKYIFLPITLLLSLSKGVLTLLMVGSLALTLATVTSSAVFSVLSSTAEAIIGPRTVRNEHRDRVIKLETENSTLSARSDQLRHKNQTLSAELDETNARYSKRIDALREKNRLLTKQSADTKVIYRGKEQFAKDAVKDTSQKLANRVTIASSRNIATVFAEALPVVGIGVIVGATAWEINDSCEMMKDLHELDVAFNPDSAIDGTEVCGMSVPDRADVWQKIRESPAAAWNRAKDDMPELPDFSETYASGVARATSLACWLFPCDTDEVIPE